MRFILSVLLIVASPAFAGRACEITTAAPIRPASPQGFAPTSLVAWYFHFAKLNAHVSQVDPAFAQAGFLIPGGGLCAFTTILNFAKIGAASLGLKYEAQPAHLMGLMLNQYGTELRTDARLGGELKGVLDAATAVFGHSIYSRALPEPVTADTIYSWQRQWNGVFFAHVSGFEAGYEHALVILAIDVFQRELVISDPNFPNFIYRTPYLVTPSGHIQLDLYQNRRVYLNHAYFIGFTGREPIPVPGDRALNLADGSFMDSGSQRRGEPPPEGIDLRRLQDQPGFTIFYQSLSEDARRGFDAAVARQTPEPGL